MKDPSFYVASLLELASATPNDRRVLWRQAMAALSRTSADGGPGPLEGLHPDVLLKGVQVALEGGLVDDLDWLAPQAAGVALYSLAAALPVGSEQRELGRRVLSRMLAANAETFTAMATIMAQTAGKGLSSPAIRARVALVCELPVSHGIADGPLALALVSRREYAREWVATPSTRSLPARRLAAKILERAAREAARRAQMGDAHALRAFASDTVRGAYVRLLADRESLVWRYVAVARGLCAPWMPELKQQILDGLREALSPTEWRRATASLAALAAVQPGEALKIMQGLVKRGFFTLEDPASASAFVWGIPRAIEAEPEAATKLLDLLLSVATPEVGEAIGELRFEYGASRAVERAAAKALELVRSEKAKPRGGDDGADALHHEIARDLEGSRREDEPLRVQASMALDAFATEGALGAYTRARDTVMAARGGMDALAAVARDDDAEGRTGSMARRTSMAVLRDLDAALLERPIVADLLKLGGSTEQVRGVEDALDAIRERLAEWIVACETPDEVSAPGMNPRHATLRLRRLRALLHLVDGDLGEGATMSEPVSRPRGESGEGADVQRAKRLRALWLRTVKALLEHFDQQPAPVLKRTLLAALARALDALVRLGVCDVVDALLVLAQRIKTTEEFDTLAEASMDPDLRHVLVRYAQFLRETDGQKPIAKKPSDPKDSVYPPSIAPPPGSPTEQRLKAFEELANELAPEASARSEALRTVFVRLHAALVSIVHAGSLRALATSDASDPDVLGNVETWASALVQMSVGARGRLDPELPTMALSPPQPKLLSMVVSRVLAGAELSLVEEALGPAIDELMTGLPVGIARLVASILWSLVELPIERPSRAGVAMMVGEQLPAWLPARRTIGGFYVVRALGVGGTASVFVVNRVEDRHEQGAERFALKVPDYTATAARSVSQDEFLKLFREEASALIMLPNHVNLARFVTFDLAARPLPILVMELVEGVTLERVIGSRTFDMKRCLKALDDVLAGLVAMHSVGLGHLDLKPSNVLLRRGEQAVLVDFGLAGRKIRPGCGTGPYGSPEVWGVVPDNVVPSPMAADIYSFGCLAFEMLTGKVLFDAPNEVTQITMHVSHDGAPLPMRSLIANPEVGPLAEVLVPTLRRDPRHRPTAEELRNDIRAVASMVEEARWPVSLGGNRAE
ncbi:serine/threonine-protein kinase [Labilithrix luteola]|uniref:serine/threonine-protein kinase n=1 Tax=Labilithrix luteola TaxID=1391654 RepID=UPI0011BAA8B7|nr:serine/threonine-protein kinase [Labilithrix luteola]